MATVYLRNGVYYAKYFEADGKRVSKNTGASKKREAQKIAARMETEALALREKVSEKPKAYAAILETATREAQAGDLSLARAEELLRRLRAIANPEYRDISVDAWFGEWIEIQRPHIGESTLGSYCDARRRITEALGNRKSQGPLEGISTSDIRAAISTIAKTVRASTANMDLRAFRRVLEAACGEQLLSANPAKQVRPLPTDDSTERAPFTASEVRKLIDTTKSEEWKGLILIAAHTGLRMGDVLKLTSEDVNGSDLISRPQKTKKSKQVIRIPMTPPVAAWVATREGRLFPTLSQRTVQTHSTNFPRLMAKAGVARDVKLPGGIVGRRSFHSLRHSFTSWLAEADIHSDVRRKLTGHKSAGVHDLYTHHDSALARAIESLPDLTSLDKAEHS